MPGIRHLNICDISFLYGYQLNSVEKSRKTSELRSATNYTWITLSGVSPEWIYNLIKKMPKQLENLCAMKEMEPFNSLLHVQLRCRTKMISKAIKPLGKFCLFFFFSFLMELQVRNKLIAGILGNIDMHTLRNEWEEIWPPADLFLAACWGGKK